jgi:hypothetical protein
MEIGEFLRNSITTTVSTGTFRLNELKKFAMAERKSGIAVAEIEKGTIYLLFASGEPRGAVEIDKSGTLMGDKALFLLKGGEAFSFHQIDREHVEFWIQTCRIFDQSHLNSNLSANIPIIERKNEGLGSFAIKVMKDNIPQGGLHVSIRKKGRVLGSGVTTPEGKSYFKVLFGEYDIVIMDRERKIKTFPVIVHSGGREETINLS